jgi:hypothetical protein
MRHRPRSRYAATIACKTAGGIERFDAIKKYLHRKPPKWLLHRAFLACNN